MRRGLQFVAVLVIGLLAGVPSLAGIACERGPASAASVCPMGMSGMENDCLMPRMDVLACVQDCCLKPLSTLAAKPGIVVKASIGVRTVPAPAVKLALAAAARDVPETDSPPVYILNRVFRI
jgi:hypothetical protein